MLVKTSSTKQLKKKIAIFQNTKKVKKDVCKKQQMQNNKKEQKYVFFKNKFKIISAKQQGQQLPKIVAQNNNTNCKIVYGKK